MKTTNEWMPKGKKEVAQTHAATQGESVNSFINRAIDTQMGLDGEEEH